MPIPQSHSSLMQDPYTSPPTYPEGQHVYYDFARHYPPLLVPAPDLLRPSPPPGLSHTAIDAATIELTKFHSRSLQLQHVRGNTDAEPSSSPAHTPAAKWLSDALRELAELDQDVTDDDLPEIDTTTRNEAERIIRELSAYAFAPTVYPTEDGEIVIHFKSPTAPAVVVIELSNDGQGACFSHFGGRNRRARYDDSSDLPDAFVDAQLQALVTTTGRD